MKISNTSNRLKEIIAERNLRQIDILNLAKPFCEKYGIKLTKPDLSQYLSHQSEPGREKLFILAMALNVDEAWLMGYDVPQKRQNIHVFPHEGIDNDNLLAIKVLLKNVGYDLKLFAKKYQIETPQGLIATLSPEDITKLENSSIEHIHFVANSIIKERFMPDDKFFENSNGNRSISCNSHGCSYPEPVAAHERTDTPVTDEMKDHDDDLMNKADVWK